MLFAPLPMAARSAGTCATASRPRAALAAPYPTPSTTRPGRIRSADPSGCENGERREARPRTRQAAWPGAADRRRRHPADGQRRRRRDGRPDEHEQGHRQQALPQRPLQHGGQERHQPDDGRAGHQRADRRPDEARHPEQREVDQRLGEPVLHEHEGDEQPRAQREERDARRRCRPRPRAHQPDQHAGSAPRRAAPARRRRPGGASGCPGRAAPVASSRRGRPPAPRSPLRRPPSARRCRAGR